MEQRWTEASGIHRKDTLAAYSQNDSQLNRGKRVGGVDGVFSVPGCGGFGQYRLYFEYDGLATRQLTVKSRKSCNFGKLG